MQMLLKRDIIVYVYSYCVPLSDARFQRCISNTLGTESEETAKPMSESDEVEGSFLLRRCYTHGKHYALTPWQCVYAHR
jgi:hypothetical protein